MGKRIVVTGGRRFDRYGVVQRALSAIHQKHGIDALIQGEAPGADRLCKEWAEMHGIPVVSFPADWSKGKSAGPKRNQRMIDEGKPDAGVAFPGGDGTADMAKRIKAAGIPLWDLR